MDNKYRYKEANERLKKLIIINQDVDLEKYFYMVIWEDTDDVERVYSAVENDDYYLKELKTFCEKNEIPVVYETVENDGKSKLESISF